MAAARGKHAPQSQPQNRRKAVKLSRARRVGLIAMIAGAAVAAALPVLAPTVLSASDLLAWANSPHGLGLHTHPGLNWFVMLALDALALCCILVALVCAILDKRAGLIFTGGVWGVAAVSAFANFSFGLAPGAPPHRWWFFPIMSFLGPIMVHGAVSLIRRIAQEGTARRATDLPKFGLSRWLPIVGAPRDTYGARRTAQILQITTAAEAIRAYHELCPDGSLRVVQAIRNREADAARRVREQADHDAEQARLQAAWEADRARKAIDREDRRIAAAGSTNGSTGRSTTSRPHGATVRALVPPARPTTPDQRSTNGTDHSPTAVADARSIRLTWPGGPPPDRGLQRLAREQFGWSAGKASAAVQAYNAGADQLDRSAAADPTADQTGADQ